MIPPVELQAGREIVPTVVRRGRRVERPELKPLPHSAATVADPESHYNADAHPM